MNAETLSFHRPSSCRRLMLAGLFAASALPALALTNATATASFASVSQGVQVTPDWVFTVVHLGQQVGQAYANGFGGRAIAAVYQAPGSGTFPANDFALLRLAPAATVAPYLTVNADLYADGPLALPATIASGLGAAATRNAAFTTITEASVKADPDDSGPLGLVTVNWLVSMDSTVHVQGGDSGGALFAGHVSNSGTLLGVTSALIEDDQHAPLGSAFVQPAAYRSWIDATMAADLADTESVRWVSAVPEPATWVLWLAGLALLGGGRKAIRSLD